MNPRIRTLLIFVGSLLAFAALPGCSRDLPTVPAARDAALGRQLAHVGGIMAFELQGHSDAVVIEYGSVVRWNRSARLVEFLTFEQAEGRLVDQDPVRFVGIRRIVPVSEWRQHFSAASMPNRSEFARQFRASGIGIEAEDPPPSSEPNPKRLCGCPCACPGLGNCKTWGCLKCCYR